MVSRIYGIKKFIKYAFRKENFKKKTALPTYISELKMIENYYGKFGVQATFYDRETVRKSQKLFD